MFVHWAVQTINLSKYASAEKRQRKWKLASFIRWTAFELMCDVRNRIRVNIIVTHIRGHGQAIHERRRERTNCQALSTRQSIRNRNNTKTEPVTLEVFERFDFLVELYWLDANKRPDTNSIYLSSSSFIVESVATKKRCLHSFPWAIKFTPEL